ncbi:MAG: hypothetical protein DWQ01_12860 [Planctomycetota bacterium]|nr:MAG: hypothetical protein DWQ01_12860 [Planctomycetota bacterium]
MIRFLSSLARLPRPPKLSWPATASMFLAAMSLMAWPTVAAGQTTETQKLVAGDGQTDDEFGSAVAIFEDFMVIGAPYADDLGTSSGAAYVFRYNDNSDLWEEEAKLLASDGNSSHHFGYAVAAFEDLILVGAPDYNGDGFAPGGAAYVYRRDHTGTWQEEALLRHSNPKHGDKLGKSVAIMDKWALVGVPEDDDLGDNSGSALLFHDDGNGNWSLDTQLLASDGGAHHVFGWSVSLFSDPARETIAAVGAPGTAVTACYMFRYEQGAWAEEQKLVQSEGFGMAVSLTQNFVLVGAPYRNDHGSAYVYRYISNHEVWELDQELIPSDVATDDECGAAVCMFDDIAFLGSPRDDDGGSNSGSAYVFRYSGGRKWAEDDKLAASDAAADYHFGEAVAINDVHVGVGASDSEVGGSSRGAVYTYDGRVYACSLSCTPETLPSGGTVEVDFRDGTPMAPVWLGYSLTGLGSFPVPPLGVVLDLDQPFSIGPPLITDPLGAATWSLSIPNVQGIDVWLQAVQVGLVSNYLATDVQ